MRPTPDTDSIVSSSLLHAAVSNLRSAATYGTDGNNRCIDPQSVTQLDKLCMLFISLLSMPRQSQIFKNIFFLQTCRKSDKTQLHTCSFLSFSSIPTQGVMQCGGFEPWCQLRTDWDSASSWQTPPVLRCHRDRLPIWPSMMVGDRQRGREGGYIKIWIDTWRFSPGNVDEKFSERPQRVASLSSHVSASVSFSQPELPSLITFLLQLL